MCSVFRSQPPHLALFVLHFVRRLGHVVDAERRHAVGHVDAILGHQLRALVLVDVEEALLKELQRLQRALPL